MPSSEIVCCSKTSLLTSIDLIIYFCCRVINFTFDGVFQEIEYSFRRYTYNCMITLPRAAHTRGNAKPYCTRDVSYSGRESAPPPHATPENCTKR